MLVVETLIVHIVEGEQLKVAVTNCGDNSCYINLSFQKALNAN